MDAVHRARLDRPRRAHEGQRLRSRPGLGASAHAHNAFPSVHGAARRPVRQAQDPPDDPGRARAARRRARSPCAHGRGAGLARRRFRFRERDGGVDRHALAGCVRLRAGSRRRPAERRRPQLDELQLGAACRPRRLGASHRRGRLRLGVPRQRRDLRLHDRRGSGGAPQRVLHGAGPPVRSRPRSRFRGLPPRPFPRGAPLHSPAPGPRRRLCRRRHRFMPVHELSADKRGHGQNGLRPGSGGVRNSRLAARRRLARRRASGRPPRRRSWRSGEDGPCSTS